MARPKQCSGCKKTATIHLTQIVDHKIYKIDMCEDCVFKDAVSDPGMSLGEIISQDVSHDSANPGLTCPNCGATHRELQETGRFGCSECYHTFAESIEGSLRRFQAGLHHEGKQPHRSENRKELQERLRGLQESLSAAVSEERFEEAALLRDQIRELSP